jgi:hypothetical protein
VPQRAAGVYKRTSTIQLPAHKHRSRSWPGWSPGEVKGSRGYGHRSGAKIAHAIPLSAGRAAQRCLRLRRRVVRRSSHLGFGSSRCGLYAAGASWHVHPAGAVGLR